MKRRIACGCVVLFLLAAGGGTYGYFRLRGGVRAAERTVAVDRGVVEVKVTETGSIEALRKVEVKSKVAGRLARVLVQEGDRVRAGQTLAEIDPTEINSQVEQIRAQCEGARASLQAASRGAALQVEQTRSSIRQAEQALLSAQSRLRVAREQAAAQPELTGSDLEQARASLRTAEDNLDLLRTATHPQAVVTTQTTFDQARAAEANARRNLDRQKALLGKGFASQQAVDGAESELASAQAHLEQARKRLELIDQQNRLEERAAQNRLSEARAALKVAEANRTNLTVRNEDVLSAQASVEQARAQVAVAYAGRRQDRISQDHVVQARAAVTQIENQLREVEVRQGDTLIVSTIDGIVTRRYVEQGELVTSGVSTFSSGTPVFQVADLSRMLVRMTVNEVDVHRLRPGLPVELAADGVRGVPIVGVVRKVAPAAQSAAGEGAPQGAQGSAGVVRFAVEVLVDRADSRLRPGMSSRCTIVIARRADVLRLPADCVEGTGSKGKVQVATDRMVNGRKTITTTPRDVVVGLRGDSHVQIVSGLKEGERVKPGKFAGPKRRGIDMKVE